MSLVFNDTSTYKGIVQLFEKECGFPRGTISGDTDRLKELAADVNLAFDDFVQLAIQSNGTWQWDDSNQTDYPIITTNIVSGQRDYAFTSDSSGNLILDVFKVFVANSNGVFSEIKAVDVQSDSDLSSFTDGQNTGGAPVRYDKTANGIFLDPIPNYNRTAGLKVYVNREPSYFTSSDTTKKPGVPGILHKWFVLRPAQDYARRNTLATLPRLEIEVLRMEQTIQDYFSSRIRDERQGFGLANESNK